MAAIQGTVYERSLSILNRVNANRALAKDGINKQSVENQVAVVPQLKKKPKRKKIKDWEEVENGNNDEENKS